MTEAGANTETVETEQTQSTTLKVDGIFDVGAALKLREAIAQLPQETPVTLDFSHARDCHDFALAALIHALATMNRTAVMTRGLSQHHHRLLKYLGQEQLS